jgi:3-methyladenine DNA glycosylase/8-oxoguanine DNA glycosylase
VATARGQEIRSGLAWLHAADPVLARVIDDRPGFDPDAWVRRLPSMDLFGALVFQVIGQQISVTAATAIQGDRRVDRVWRACHRAAAARCHPY